MRTFGKVLRDLREERHMSQAKLGEALGLSSSTIGMYETGDREPNQDTKDTIADYFNVDMNYLHGKTLVRNSYRELPDESNFSIGVKIPVLGIDFMA